MYDKDIQYPLERYRIGGSNRDTPVRSVAERNASRGGIGHIILQDSIKTIRKYYV